MKHLLTTILTIIFCASVFAQENQRDTVIFSTHDIEKIEKEYFAEEIPISNETNRIQHTLFYEFLGSSAAVYNIGYDISFSLANRHKIAVAVGVQYPLAEFPGLYGGSLQINYLFGRTHHLEIGTGLTYLRDSRYEYIPYYILFPVRIGYRFQQNNGGFFGKVAFTPLFTFITPTFDIPRQLPYIMPWGGIAIGYTFRNRK